MANAESATPTAMNPTLNKNINRTGPTKHFACHCSNKNRESPTGNSESSTPTKNYAGLPTPNKKLTARPQQQISPRHHRQNKHNSSESPTGNSESTTPTTNGASPALNETINRASSIKFLPAAAETKKCESSTGKS